MSTSEEVFTDICRGNRWGGTESVSGGGSDLFQTRIVRETLPSVLRTFSAHSMLDIPCGDFHWMKHVDLESIDYTGADLVMDLVRRNSQQHQSPNVHFCKLNLLEDKLPKVDVVFCRDCLVHLSFKDVLIALHNICGSDSTYLFTTTFTSRQHNSDIVTGAWRTLNLQVAPFSFPPPLILIDEECTEGDGAFGDKSLGLWKVSDIRESLTKHSN
ncbi:MAG: class I SAM-dependent methyltransferase [Acidobacteria bacterium]|nr:class I SAM-dependent methyltransferase [Acidobacteriota bacterium]